MFEKVFLNRMIKFMSFKNQLSGKLFGFRKGKSTIIGDVASLSDMITKELENRQCIVISYCDGIEVLQFLKTD